MDWKLRDFDMAFIVLRLRKIGNEFDFLVFKLMQDSKKKVDLVIFWVYIEKRREGDNFLRAGIFYFDLQL